MMYTHKLSKY